MQYIWVQAAGIKVGMPHFPDTCKNHAHNILRKLEVSSREETAFYLPLIDEEEG